MKSKNSLFQQPGVSKAFPSCLPFGVAPLSSSVDLFLPLSWFIIHSQRVNMEETLVRAKKAAWTRLWQLTSRNLACLEIPTFTTGMRTSLQPIHNPSYSFAETNDTTGLTVDPEILDKRDKAELLRWITLGIGAGFLSISAINFIMFMKYKRMEDYHH